MTSSHELGRTGSIALRLAQHVRKLDGSPSPPLNWSVSSLLAAAEDGDIERVRLLLEQGADVDEMDGIYTPLVLAVQEQHIDVCRILLEHGADARRPARPWSRFHLDRRARTRCRATELTRRDSLPKINLFVVPTNQARLRSLVRACRRLNPLAV